MMTDIHSLARIALAILWGGALCGLGTYALLSLLAAINVGIGAARSERAEEDAKAGVLFIPAFVAATLYTLSVADVFHVIDWIRHRS